MSLLRRIAIVIKSYLADAESRIERVASDEEMLTPDDRRRALDELRATRGSSDKAPAETASSSPVHEFSHELLKSYKTLGLQPPSEPAIVEREWRRLAERADPKRFPAGSEEERRAADILNSINDAYAKIREHLNPTEGRFGRLEL